MKLQQARLTLTFGEFDLETGEIKNAQIEFTSGFDGNISRISPQDAKFNSTMHEYNEKFLNLIENYLEASSKTIKAKQTTNHQ